MICLLWFLVIDLVKFGFIIFEKNKIKWKIIKKFKNIGEGVGRRNLFCGKILYLYKIYIVFFLI